MAVEPYTFSNFTAGINRFRQASPPEDGALYDAINAYLTAGHTWKRRPGFRKDVNGPYANCFGLVGFAGKLHTFYSTGAPPSTALVQPHKVVCPDGTGSNLAKIHYGAPLLGYLFCVAEFANGKVFYFYFDDAAAGTWAANTAYQVGQFKVPTVDNGLRFMVTSVIAVGPWYSGLKVTPAGTVTVQPTVPNGRSYQATAVTLPAGVTVGRTGKIEPNWPEAVGATVVEYPSPANITAWTAGAHVATGEMLLPPRMIGNGVMFQATYNGATGKNVNTTGAVEPEWTNAVGATYNDGTVVWTCVAVASITWTCGTPNKTGAVEPTWPTTPGLTVVDNTITWTAVGKHIQDTNCPNTKQAIVLAGKIWAQNGDKVSFCAAANARAWQTANQTWQPSHRYKAGDQIVGNDGSCQQCVNTVWGWSGSGTEPVWNKLVGGLTNDTNNIGAGASTAVWQNVGIAAFQDAGYLNVAVNTQGDTAVSALASYAGMLVVHTASGMQLWQVDPDPTQNALIKAVEGTGSVFIRGSAEYGNSLYYATPLGVRSLRTVLETGQYAVGDAGMPVDSLVTGSISLGDVFTPLAAVVPSAGMFWLAAGNAIYVYTDYPKEGVAGWSRYALSWNVQYIGAINGAIYVLANDNNLYLYDPTYHQDDTAGASNVFSMQLISPYMVVGRHTMFAPEATMGYKKQIMGIGVISRSAFSMQVGYDESQTGNLTAAINVGPDDREGGIVPLDVMCQSLSWQLTHTANEDQELFAFTTWYTKLQQAVG